MTDGFLTVIFITNGLCTVFILRPYGIMTPFCKNCLHIYHTDWDLHSLLA